MEILIPTVVEHCQHCSPTVEWLETEPGKPPHFVFKGFPRAGQCVLSNKTVVVVCERCTSYSGPVVKMDA